jgi:LysM repeat protein
MKTRGPASLLRCATVWLVATAIAAALVIWSLEALGGLAQAASGAGLAGQPFDHLLVWLSALLTLIATTWLWLIVDVVMIEAVSGRRQRIAGIPDSIRRVVLRACGVAVASGLAASLCGPAGATPGRPHQDEFHRPRPTAVIAGLPLPDRATTGLPARGRLSVGPVTADPPDPPRPTSRHTILVRPGDTLWDIARRELGPDPDDGQIAARWREIYRLNRDLVGADPDLIQPAQRLRLPTGVRATTQGGNHR